MSVRPDEHIVTDNRGVPRARGHGIFHHHSPGTDTHVAVLGGEHGTEQDTGVRPDTRRAAQNRRRRDIGIRVDLRGTTPMFNQHLPACTGRRH
jgi:hypothetical protein